MSTSAGPSPSLFRLTELHDFSPSPTPVRSLSVIEPRFVLPSLDEYASTTERLLESLLSSPSYASDVFGSAEDGRAKGKQKEVIEEPTVRPGYEAVKGFGDGVWEEATREIEAGPSRLRIYKVSFLSVFNDF